MHIKIDVVMHKNCTAFYLLKNEKYVVFLCPCDHHERRVHFIMNRQRASHQGYAGCIHWDRSAPFKNTDAVRNCNRQYCDNFEGHSGDLRRSSWYSQNHESFNLLLLKIRWILFRAILAFFFKVAR